MRSCERRVGCAHRRTGFMVGAAHPTSRNRKGVVMIAVLAAIFVATSLIVLWVSQVARTHRHLRQRQAGLQAAWLAEAGLQRAAARLAASEEYAGEVWPITADELIRREGARVTIDVQAVGDDPRLRVVAVVADYPDDTLHRNRRSKRVVVHLDAWRDSQ